MRWLLGLLAVVMVTAGLTVGAVKVLDAGKDGDDASTTGTTTAPVIIPAEGQSVVTGTLTALAAIGAQIAPLGMPITVTTPERGNGAGATFAGAIVDGQPATIAWDAGRPLELSGEGGALVVGPVAFNADPSAIVIGLDGPVHGFAPAAYNIATPVAVGAGGLADPVAGVAFEADAGTSVVFAGGAAVTLPPQAWTLLGPGAVTLTGVFKVQTLAGTVDATTVSLPEGSFEVTITPDGAGTYTVTAKLQGPTETA